MSPWWLLPIWAGALSPLINVWYSRRCTRKRIEDREARLALIDSQAMTKRCPKCGIIGHSCPNFVPPPYEHDHENEGPLYPPW